MSYIKMSSPKIKVNNETNESELNEVILEIRNSIKNQEKKINNLQQDHRKIERKNSLNQDVFLSRLEDIHKREQDFSKTLVKTSSKRYCCCYKLRFTKRISEAILELDDLSKLEKVILRRRYIKMIEDIEKETKHISFTYNLFKFMIQTGSLIIPAILSIQHFYSGDAIDNPLYWASWGTSIGVGLLTNYVGVFKLDQKFYKINSLLEKLKIEGWQYIELSGKYSHTNHSVEPTHKNKFRQFCNQIEEMKKKHIEIEFTSSNKTDDINIKLPTPSLLKGKKLKIENKEDKIKLINKELNNLKIKLKGANEETKKSLNKKISELNNLLKKIKS